MVFLIGGSNHGKLDFARCVYKEMLEVGAEDSICEGVNVTLDLPKRIGVLNNLHIYIRRMLEEGRENEIFSNLQRVIDNNPDVIFITDEIGYGIVPIDAFERHYREVTGRICCQIAKEADRMIRVVYGIGTVLKEKK